MNVLDDNQRVTALPRTRQGWFDLLDEVGVRPSKGLGQNFLFERGVVERMVRLADFTPDEHVVEVGPGLGILTEALLQAVGQVTAIEYDPRLAVHLQRLFAPEPRFHLIQADALTVDSKNLAERQFPFAVAANLPYAVGSGILRHLLDQPVRPRRIVVMLQLEVAERIVAKPGDMSVLSVASQFYTEPRILFRVPPAVFLPAPNVQSAVVRLDSKVAPPVAERDIPHFFQVVNAGFRQRRKMLVNSLTSELGIPKNAVFSWLEEAGISPDRRAERLTVDEWVALTEETPDEITRLLTDRSNVRDAG